MFNIGGIHINARPSNEGEVIPPFLYAMSSCALFSTYLALLFKIVLNEMDLAYPYMEACNLIKESY
jgi:hypothetical protein